jgi:dipeptide/tripeptide permease
MMGFEFIDTDTPFSVFNAVQAVALVSFQIFQGSVVNTLSEHSLELYTTAVMVLGVLMCGITYFFQFKKFGKVEGTE